MDELGRVYWITGLKSSGKTTIGTALYYTLRKKYNNVLILDGDILKEFVGEVVGYEENERHARARRYSQLCKLLVDQGIIVVICTISMFHDIREWNRKNIKGYVEIFVDTPIELIIERDKSKLYSYDEIKSYRAMAQVPVQPDIILRNDGEESIMKMVQDILRIIPKSKEDFARDRLYWNQFYGKKQQALLKPSNFALTVVEQMVPGKHLLELGCGNGRDSLFFSSKGIYVTGVDASDKVIHHLQSSIEDNDKAIFICDNFVKCRALYQRQYDYIYSRFTLHSITEEQEDELLQNIREAMIPGSKLFIEARTIHDDIYGKGTEVAPNAFVYDGHFRRFIEPGFLKKKMLEYGYEILSFEENKGFSVTEESDPVLLRVVACM